MTTRIQNIFGFPIFFPRTGSERPSRPRVSHQTSESADGPGDIKAPRTWALGLSRCHICPSALGFSYLRKERGLQDLQHSIEAGSPWKSGAPESPRETAGVGAVATPPSAVPNAAPSLRPQSLSGQRSGSAEVRAWRARPAAPTEVYPGRRGSCLHRPGAGACLALAPASYCSANWNSPNFLPN